MQELIKITQNAVTGNQTVDARELHEFLEVKTQFKDWILRRIHDYQFIENQDFQVSLKNELNLNGGRPSKEYTLSLDCAKELAMVERNEKGKQVRLYFIECEKRYREQQVLNSNKAIAVMQDLVAVLSSQSENYANLVKEQMHISRRLLEIEEQQQTAPQSHTPTKKQRATKEPYLNWRHDVDKVLADAYEVTLEPTLTVTMKWIIERVPRLREMSNFHSKLKEYLAQRYHADLKKNLHLSRFNMYMGAVQQEHGLRVPIYATHVGRPLVLRVH